MKKKSDCLRDALEALFYMSPDEVASLPQEEVERLLRIARIRVIEKSGFCGCSERIECFTTESGCISY